MGDIISDVCNGYRCLDRNECFMYSDDTKVTTHVHNCDDCNDIESEEQLTLPYLTREKTIRQISRDYAEELMQCIYTSKLLFEESRMLRNYAFWGYSDSMKTEFNPFAPSQLNLQCSNISNKVAIGHVDELCDQENLPLGLFAIENIDIGEYLGEYTGVIRVHRSGTRNFDSYGLMYPSVFQDGDVYVTAAEYGNIIRCINHSSNPNTRFFPMVQEGILHILAFLIRPVIMGEQILVNYGDAYWDQAGIHPLTL